MKHTRAACVLSALTAAVALTCVAAGDAGPVRGREGQQTGATAANRAAPAALPRLRPHPFGVITSGASAEEKVRRAQVLGARYYRPLAIFLPQWNGRNAECDAAQAAGLDLVLTVRNSPGQGTPATPVEDAAAFRKKLDEILARYRPAMLVVECEENSKLFYDGTAQDYLRELDAAAAVAHSRSIKVTNGGLVSDLVAILVAEELKEQGNAAAADDYLARTMNDRKWQKMQGTARWTELVAKGNELLAGYKTAGADYVNFHWYNTDPTTMSRAVDYLKKAAGLPVMANELGQQKSTDPKEVTGMMQNAVDLGLPIAIWFSIDIDSHAQARGLFNDDGSLRPNGVAYREFLVRHYGP